MGCSRAVWVAEYNVWVAEYDAGWAAARDAEYVYHKKLKELEDEDT